MNTYAKARKELAEGKAGAGQGCRVCAKAAPCCTLSDFGGMCFPCFQAYCREAMPARVDVGDKRKGLRDWAHALERRHAAGESLTPGQIAAYRSAMRDPRHESGAAE